MSGAIVPANPSGPFEPPPPPQADAPSASDPSDFASLLALAWSAPPMVSADVPTPGPNLAPEADASADAASAVAEITAAPDADPGAGGDIPLPILAMPISKTVEADLTSARASLARATAGTVDLALASTSAQSATPAGVRRTDRTATPATDGPPQVERERQRAELVRDDDAQSGRSRRAARAEGPNASEDRPKGATGADRVDARAEVVRGADRRSIPQPGAPVDVAAVLTAPRRSGAPLNASTLKPLFDGRLAARETVGAEPKLDAAPTNGVSLAAADGGSPFPGSVAVPAHTARAIVGQTFDAVLAETERVGNRETKQLDLHLSPKELGDVDVRLSKDADGRLSAMLLTDRETARHALAGGIDMLREALERSGVVVDRLDVGVGSGGGSASREQTFNDRSGASPAPELATPGGTASRAGVDHDDRLLSIRA